MMIASLYAFGGVFALCAAASTVAQHRASKRRARAIDAGLQRIDATLTLIQLLQKHRGLGAQESETAAAQRAQIAREIDQRWRDGEAHMRELNYLHEQWRNVRQTPGDFDGHSLIIKHLLGVIEVLALRSDGDGPAACLAFAEHCRALEDLARLRGLCVRAAQFPHCPIELKVPLKYLCRNLHRSALPCDRAALHHAIAEIDSKMLDAYHTSISPARCFDLLTPIIDNALSELRRRLRALGPRSDRAPAHRVSRSAPARGVLIGEQCA